MVREEVKMAGQVPAWTEADLAGPDAPISVWWDNPPAPWDDDDYGRKNVVVAKQTIRTSRS